MSSAASNLVNRDDSLGDSSDLPDPAVLAAEIVEDLQAALDQFAQIAANLGVGERDTAQVDSDRLANGRSALVARATDAAAAALRPHTKLSRSKA
jgi:hypothetical protein